MPYRENLNHKLQLIIEYIEIIVIIFAIIILVITISRVIFKYFYNIRNSIDYQYTDIDTYRLFILKQISLLLSFLLAIEILKIFYVTSYRQLIIVASLGLLKLTISYFIAQEMIELKKDIYLHNKN
jgi:hypothetical protein|tara:strand:- start:8600 stop:8977 length:378 start_codon:yes stop_codon:yes gene_type:complete